MLGWNSSDVIISALSFLLRVTHHCSHWPDSHRTPTRIAAASLQRRFFIDRFICQYLHVEQLTHFKSIAVFKCLKIYFAISHLKMALFFRPNLLRIHSPPLLFFKVDLHFIAINKLYYHGLSRSYLC